ncbi:hypothetical protein P691DRAFT_805595 [Macrolepiota fuliginosa MF-IS2]|uniref:Uncharacterized protein n=1 Tax=Macrolepiota fuliginosa MF-IS2 TaxID=1400762 RepID=A0A9P5WWR9_9AGAR|nr:hypothetical protein P691DRAFT_805595 [Macrolepiota fuliginosa MF-IS2]
MHRFSHTTEGLARRAGTQLDAKSDGEPSSDFSCDSLIPLSSTFTIYGNCDVRPDMHLTIITLDASWGSGWTP